MRSVVGLLLAFAIQLPIGAEECRPITDQLAEDRAIIDLVLQDFATSNTLTFGKVEGLLALDPDSKNLSHATVLEGRRITTRIAGYVTDALIQSLIDRNRSSVSLAPFVDNSPWARFDESATEAGVFSELPAWAKASGSLTLPGFSADGCRALVQISHSWSIHGAVITYVLSRDRGAWHIEAHEQAISF